MNHSQQLLLRAPRQSLVLGAVLLLTVLGTLWPQATPATARPAAQGRCFLKTILFVSGSRPLPARDEPLRLYLSLLGNIVVVRNGNEVQAADAIGKDLVIISESVESVEVNTKLRNIPVPIVTWEGWLQDDLGMVEAEDDDDGSANHGGNGDGDDDDRGPYGEIIGETEILIVDPNHPLAAGYIGKVTTVVNRENKFHWGKPNENAQVVARDPQNEKRAMIYAYAAGTPMVGLVAPAKRVFIHNATGPDLTNAGLALFLSAVDWAADCHEEPATATPTVTPTASATATPTQSFKATETATATPTATATATPTQQPPPTQTATPRPGATATLAVTPTPSATVTILPTATPTATITVTPTPSATLTSTPEPPVALTLQKRDLLFVDGDESGTVSPGDILLYLITIRNDGGTPLREIILEDQPDAGTVLVADSIQSTHGTVQMGNQPTDGRVVIAINELAPNSTALISLRVQVLPTAQRLTLANQAQLRYTASGPTGQQLLASDDPDTQTAQDATITLLFNGAPGGFTMLYLPLITR